MASIKINGKKLRLKLVKEDNQIVLVAVGKDGNKLECGNILIIQADGYFSRAHAVNPDIGLKLTEDGQYKERK